MGLLPDDIAGQAINAGMGMIMGEYEDQRQIRQQRKLGDLAFEQHQRQSQFNQGMALDMWEKTGYGAQVKQMQDAGLNVGLMYGGVGSGGTTMGAGAAVESGQAMGSKGEVGMALQLGMQKRMQEAQIKVAESQANLNNTNAQKIAGPDTRKTNAETVNIQSITDNALVQNQILQWEEKMKGLDWELKDYSMHDLKSKVTNEAWTVYETLQKLQRENVIGSETLDKTIEYMNLQAASERLKQENLKADSALKRSGIELNDTQMQNIAANIRKTYGDNARAWWDMELKEKQTEINRILAEAGVKQIDFNTSTAAQIKQWTGIIGDVIELGTVLPSKGMKPIGFNR